MKEQSRQNRAALGQDAGSSSRNIHNISLSLSAELKPPINGKLDEVDSSSGKKEDH